MVTLARASRWFCRDFFLLRFRRWPEDGHEPGDQEAYDTAQQHFANAPDAQLDPGELGVLFYARGDNDGGGDRRLAEHHLLAHDIGGEQDAYGEGQRQFPFAGPAHHEDDEAGRTAKHRVDNTAAEIGSASSRERMRHAG